MLETKNAQGTVHFFWEKFSGCLKALSVQGICYFVVIGKEIFSGSLKIIVIYHKQNRY